jgi:hypothetical protein
MVTTTMMTISVSATKTTSLMRITLPPNGGKNPKRGANRDASNSEPSFISKGVSDEYAKEIAEAVSVDERIAKSGILRARMAGVSDPDIARLARAGFFSDSSLDWGRWRSILHAAGGDIEVMKNAENAGIGGAELTEMKQGGAGAEEIRVLARLNKRLPGEPHTVEGKKEPMSAATLSQKMERSKR